MKYLGIILDHKFRFNEHTKYTAERCGKLIHSLARVAKLTWGVKHVAMDIMYKGAILPLLTYGAPVWIEWITNTNRRKYIRVQRLINISMQRRTAPHRVKWGPLHVAATTPIVIKLEETVKRYNTKKRKNNFHSVTVQESWFIFYKTNFLH